MIEWFRTMWRARIMRRRILAEHIKDCIIRLSALEGKSESGTVKSRLDNLTIRVEQIEKGEG